IHIFIPFRPLRLQILILDKFNRGRPSPAKPPVPGAQTPQKPLLADLGLTPFFDKENFLGNRYDSAEVQGLLADERIETDETARVALLEQIQGVLAEDLSTLPLLQGSQIAVTGTDIEGVEKTIDGSFQFRFATFVKGGDNSAKVTVGTTDVVAYLDPAFTYDNGSYVVQANVFPMVMAFQQGNPAPQPSLAESCEFTAEGYEYTCKIRSGLKWANGHTLDANDIKFTYDRQQAIAHPNGPSSLLANLVSTEVADPLTVVFKLAGPFDVTFPQVLASPVGPVVDDEVFNPTDITPPEEILAANAFAGAYTITTFTAGELIEFAPNPGYDGIQGQVQNGGVVTRYYKEGNNMRLDIESGEIDVVWRSLTATDYAQLETSDKVKVLHGPGGEIRYIVFNLETMPGDTPEQRLAVRQAVALSIDRPALAEQVYQGSYTPLCSYVPDGLPGATQSVCDLYGGE
ncbi:MAG: ABC transporter substrate-binding protein, partial [Bifidobacteriaceae bacterium]|nr:ABC transporter substrate-binding protein [Bifidobacteriaceae bacterium]